MNNLSNAAAISKTQNHHHFLDCCRPIPPVVLYILALLFLTGLGVSIFILVVVHNALFFIIILFLSVFVAGFLLWNSLNFTRNAAVLFLLRSFPDSDLSLASHGQLVKITGVCSLRVLYFHIFRIFLVHLILKGEFFWISLGLIFMCVLYNGLCFLVT